MISNIINNKHFLQLKGILILGLRWYLREIVLINNSIDSCQGVRPKVMQVHHKYTVVMAT